MKAFKLFYKITSKNIADLFIQLAVFIGIFLVMFFSISQDNSSEIKVDKVPVAIFNEDQEDPITDSFVRVLDHSTRQNTSIKDDSNAISDAIIFEEIFYSIRIPEGFGDSLRNGKFDENPLEIQKALGETTATIVDTEINQFLSLYKVYQASENGEISADQEPSILQNIEDSFQEKVSIRSFGTSNSNQEILLLMFFGLLCYFLYTTGISLVGLSMVSMDDRTIRSREIASGYPQIKRSFGLYFASLLLMMIFWIIGLIIGGILFKEAIFSGDKMPLIILSSFLHMLAVGSIAIFIGTIAPNKNFINFFSTVFALFVAFSSGIFIPTEFLWGPFKNIAYFTPTIWHMELNSSIMESSGNIEPSIFLQPVAIQVIMFAAFLLLSLAYRRRQQFKGLS
ncbi:MAG: ABC transporter permease [Gallicola sp.]|nr:ABC transporter permease [Gallicola sp.]